MGGRSEEMTPEDLLEKGLAFFIVDVCCFKIEPEAHLYLRKHLEKKKDRIINQLRENKKSYNDLIDGFKKLTIVASYFAAKRLYDELPKSDKPTPHAPISITEKDMMLAIRQCLDWCNIWPLCDGDS